MEKFGGGVLIEILSFCDPIDLIRWRTVNKFFSKHCLAQLENNLKKQDGWFVSPENQPKAPRSRSPLEMRRQLEKKVASRKIWVQNSNFFFTNLSIGYKILQD